MWIVKARSLRVRPSALRSPAPAGRVHLTAAAER